MTDVGLAKLAECSADHFGAVERLLGERLDEEEIASLVELLGRLSEPDDDACEPPA